MQAFFGSIPAPPLPGNGEGGWLLDIDLLMDVPRTLLSPGSSRPMSQTNPGIEPGLSGKETVLLFDGQYVTFQIEAAFGRLGHHVVFAGE